MGRGLPKKYAKMGFAKGWKAYKAKRKNPYKKVYKGRTTSKSTGKRKMARRRYKKRRKRKTRTIPLAPIIGFFGPLLGAKYGGKGIIDHIKEGDFTNAAKDACVLTTGFDPVWGTFNIQRAEALKGLLIGILVHKVAGYLGANRVFSNLPSPLNKLRI